MSVKPASFFTLPPKLLMGVSSLDQQALWNKFFKSKNCRFFSTLDKTELVNLAEQIQPDVILLIHNMEPVLSNCKLLIFRVSENSVVGKLSEVLPNCLISKAELTDFDLEEAMSFVLGNQELLQRLLSHFLDHGGKLIKKINEDIQGKNWKDAKITAHALRGSAINLTAKKLSYAAWMVEVALAEAQMNELSELLDELIKSWESFLRTIRSYLHT